MDEHDARSPAIGQPISRYESLAKVTGQPIYAADQPVRAPLFAYFVTSAVARGRVAAIDAAPAQALRGVVKVYTHLNAPARAATPYTLKGGYVSDTNMPLTGPEIRHDGQIVAVVVAESYEVARDAAHRIVVHYVAGTPGATLDSPAAEIAHPDEMAEREKQAGDLAAAWESAPVRIDHEYRTPTQHHNAMELFSTTASWTDGDLLIQEPSQFVVQVAHGAAAMLGVDAARVRVDNPFVGGAFGGKGYMTQRTALIAAIARELGRPVRNVVTRDQGFTLATYRAETKHRVRLAADHDGRLLAYGHEAWELTSRWDDYAVAGVGSTTAMYGKPAIQTRVNLVRADRQTPGFMRSPPETPYMYALESAMDELAVALSIDPVELRRVNDVAHSPVDGARFTSRSLMECYDRAAESFGWRRRDPKPTSMRDGDWLIGYGCATACYPTHMGPASARVTLERDGTAHVEIAAHDVGQGAYTAMQQIAARELGLDPSHVTVAMGDSTLPPAPVAGSSQTTASAGSAVKLASAKVRARFGDAITADADRARAFAQLGLERIVERAEWLPPGTDGKAIAMLGQGKLPQTNQARGDSSKNGKPLMFAFGAEFVEVRVHRLTREIRVPRMTGAFAGGRIVNPRTARSQYIGGMIWGMASALLEATELDEKRGRYVNDNFADYLIATNADVPQVDVILVPETDAEVNPLGVKGIGELANVGTAAAVANAVFHATGIRVRDLPITMDKLLVPA